MTSSRKTVHEEETYGLSDKENVTDGMFSKGHTGSFLENEQTHHY